MRTWDGIPQGLLTSRYARHSFSSFRNRNDAEILRPRIGGRNGCDGTRKGTNRIFDTRRSILLSHRIDVVTFTATTAVAGTPAITRPTKPATSGQ